MSHPSSSPSPRPAVEEWERWRTRTLTGLLWTTGSACFLLDAFATFQVHSVRFAIVSGTAALLMLAAAAWRGLGFRLRAAALLVGLFAGATASLTLGGLSPNILVAMCGCVVMGTLLLGRAWGMGLVVWSAATVLVVVPLRNAGLVPIDLQINYLSPDRATLTRVAVAFVLLGSAIVASISYLLARAEELFVQKAEALAELEREAAKRRETDDQLRRTEAAFRKAQELEILGRLSSSVAHDFNNALLIIQANVDLARARPGYMDTALGDIAAAIRQATATTRQLRAFTPRAERPPHRVSLGETLAREVDLLQKILPANVALSYERPPGDLVVVGDEGQIQSIVTNLALNARDAMPEGGKLVIRLAEATAAERAEGTTGEGTGADDARPFAVIEVTDTGVGMGPETARRLFEPFFTTKGAAGTGLGLASVRAIVERAKGRVGVTTEIGVGTRFRVLWPLVAERSDAIEPERVPRPGSGTVLVVDDDAGVRGAMAKSLTLHGYSVLQAANGEDALLVGRRHREPIDVVCMDLVLPGLRPQEVIAGLRAAHPGVRVLLCSGYEPGEVGGVLEGVDAFLPKPFSPNALAATVGDLIGAKASPAPETSVPSSPSA